MKANFQTLFTNLVGQSESDAFNKLYLRTVRLANIAMWRAYARYMKQIGATYSQDFIAQPS